jgi:lipid II:glycine glycyltransferase (peptidoglycan interpeptide bridge formation enzyme)
MPENDTPDEKDILPRPHFLQSEQWRDAKKLTGWQEHSVHAAGKELRYFRRLTPAGAVLYMPGIPMDKNVLADLTAHLTEKRRRNLVLKLETCTVYDESLVQLFERHGWRPSRNIQYAFTVRMGLRNGKDAVFADMKRRARNEIRRAVSEGVRIEEVSPTDEQLERMYQLLASTSRRKDFTIRDKTFMFTLWQAFRDAGKLRLFFAVHDKDILAGATILTDDTHSFAWYKDGASTTEKSNLYGARLMLWEIAQKLCDDGYKMFDLGGIPNPDSFMESHMKGIYIFKSGFNKEVTRMMPAYELPLSRFSYKLWPKLELVYLKLYKTFNRMWY